MRIRLFLPRLRPDSLGWKVYLDLGAAIRELGHDFLLLTAGPGGQDQAGASIHLPHTAGWRRIGRVCSAAFRTRHLPADFAALRRYLRQQGGDVDVLHVENVYPGGAAAAAAAILAGWRGKLVLKPMGEDVLVVGHAHYGFRRFAVPRALVAWTLRRADAVRCSSPLVQRHVVAIGTEGICRVIPICVTDQTIAAAGESAEERGRRRAAAREALDRELDTADRPVIVALGRLHPFKGLGVIVEALVALPEARLLIAGPSLRVGPFGDYAEHLAGVAKRLGVESRVHFLGAIAPARSVDLLAAADVVVVPSHLESHNKVAIEAAAVGTPFVVTETTGIAAAVPEGGVGLVVAPDNPRVLAWGISEVLGDGWEYDPDRAASFARRYAPRVIAKELVDLYEAVLG